MNGFADRSISCLFEDSCLMLLHSKHFQAFLGEELKFHSGTLLFRFHTWRLLYWAGVLASEALCMIGLQACLMKLYQQHAPEALVA